MAVSLPALSAQPKHCGTITFHLYRRASLPVSKNTGFNVLFRQYAAVSPLRRCIAVMISTGILTCLPSGSPLGLPLGSDLPRMIDIAGESLIFRRAGFSPGIIVTYAYICFSIRSTIPHDTASMLNGMLSYRLYHLQSHSFGYMLMPAYYPCRTARLVSCYALFK